MKTSFIGANIEAATIASQKQSTRPESARRSQQRQRGRVRGECPGLCQARATPSLPRYGKEDEQMEMENPVLDRKISIGEIEETYI